MNLTKYRLKYLQSTWLIEGFLLGCWALEKRVELYGWGFYLCVLHPVAHLPNWFLMMPSIATKFQYVNSTFIFLLTHYMFDV
jgi:hypothetical protein